MKATWLAAALVLTACADPAPGTGDRSLGPGGEPLRSAFNAAEGKVRAILLAAPT